jgi:hypothetical protein
MATYDHSEEEIRRENEELKQQLILLGRDPSAFDDLLPDEMNSRLKKAVAYAEDVREAELLGKEPPSPCFDPASPHWIPDIDDMVHRTAQQLLGDDFILQAEEALSDAEVEEQLHLVIDRLAKHGIGISIDDAVPERLVYRCLLEELQQGMEVCPGWMIDGCDGCCEQCFQLPYCESGKQLSEEFGFSVPKPPIPPRSIGKDRKKSYHRIYAPDLVIGPTVDPQRPEEDRRFDDDIPF